MFDNKRLQIFILTNLAYQTVIGIYGVNSIAKSPMSQLFGYDEFFLGTSFDMIGIIDGVQMLGNLIGSFYILFLTMSPVKAFLLLAMINFTFGIILFIPRYLYMSSEVLGSAIVMGCYFAQIFCGSSLGYSQVIFSRYFDDKSKKSLHSVWFCLTYLGEIISIIFASLLI